MRYPTTPPLGVSWYTIARDAPAADRCWAVGDSMAQSDHSRDSGVGSTPSSPQGPYTASQLFFLQRLAWLQKQRRECMNVLASNDWRMRLLNKALYSTYRD